MSILPIVMHPDPVLRVVCDAVDASAECAALAEDMLETMYAAEGRGLAAPQIGKPLRMFVFDADWKQGTANPYVCINPVVTPIGTTEASVEEMCLSIPDRPVTVTRPAKIELSWLDQAMQKHTEVFEGDAAVIVQHEADHLEGRLVLDYLEDVQ